MAAHKKNRYPLVGESLRVEKHPRGHVASCNVPLERVQVKVRPHRGDHEDPRVKSDLQQILSVAPHSPFLLMYYFILIIIIIIKRLPV